MTQDEWDQKFNATYLVLLKEKDAPFWAFSRAHEIMNKKFGLRPGKDQIDAPGLIAWMKLGLQFRSFGMTAHTNLGPWLAALAAAFTTASAQYAVANADLVVSGGEWAGIAIQFVSVLLATVVKFDSKPPAPPAETPKV